MEGVGVVRRANLSTLPDSAVLAHVIATVRAEIGRTRVSQRAARARPVRAVRVGSWEITEIDGELIATCTRDGQRRCLASSNGGGPDGG